MRRLTPDEERLIESVRLTLMEFKRTHVDDQVAEEVCRLVKSIAAPRKGVSELVGPVCSTADLTKWMGISRQAVNKAVKECRILGVRKGRGSWMYPTWQLTPDHRIIEGMPEVLGRLQGITDSLEIGRWFITAHRELEGLSPANWLLERRDISEAVRVAENLARRRR